MGHWQDHRLTDLFAGCGGMTLGFVRPTYAATTSFNVARPDGAATSGRAVRGTDWPT